MTDTRGIEAPAAGAALHLLWLVLVQPMKDQITRSPLTHLLPARQQRSREAAFFPFSLTVEWAGISRKWHFDETPLQKRVTSGSATTHSQRRERE